MIGKEIERIKKIEEEILIKIREAEEAEKEDLEKFKNELETEFKRREMELLLEIENIKQRVREECESEARKLIEEGKLEAERLKERALGKIKDAAEAIVDTLLGG